MRKITLEQYSHLKKIGSELMLELQKYVQELPKDHYISLESHFSENNLFIRLGVKTFKLSYYVSRQNFQCEFVTEEHLGDEYSHVQDLDFSAKSMIPSFSLDKYEFDEWNTKNLVKQMTEFSKNYLEQLEQSAKRF